MENKDMKMDNEVLQEKDLQDDSLSGTSSLNSDALVTAENADTTPTEFNTTADTEDAFSLSEFSEYLEENSAGESAPVEAGEEKKQNTVLSYLHDLVFGLVAILLVFMLLFRGVVVSGSSMENTFIDGDYIVLLSNVFYRDPQPGDVIVASKDSFRDGEPIIKRVIATEGQKVYIDFDAGIVYVDDIPLEEPYTKTPTNETTYPRIEFPLVVDAGCVFVMGDNRNDSLDSRSPEIGLIDCREIMGKAIFLVLPGTDKGSVPRDFSRIGALW